MTLKRILSKTSRRGTVLALALGALSFGSAAQAATFTVNTSADQFNVPSCQTPATPGSCALREALEAANDNPGPDSIVFADRYEIQLTGPLFPVTGPVAIDARANGTRVFGPYDCTVPSTDSYVIDLTDPAAAGSALRGLPFFNVCNRAIKSPVASPAALRVGPRRTDGTLPISGTAEGSVDLFHAADASSLEASRFISTLSQGGAFSVPVSPEPAAGAALTATQTTGSGTSNFSPPFFVPFDVEAPQYRAAFATSLNQVRVDFSEPVATDSLAVSDFSISIAGVPRTITTIEPSGSSVFLNTDPATPWAHGEAGAITMTSAGAITDIAGNEIPGVPSARIYAAPGDFGAPVISEYVVSPRTFCTRKGPGCRVTTVNAKFNLSEDATVTFDVVKYKPGSTSRARFRDRLSAGPQSRPLTYKVSGKVIRPGRYFLMAYAQDRARNKSEQVGAFFEIKTPKPKATKKKSKKKK